jgi:antitoxin component of RelBE/YafQ-DinJ toxin-antitoxin module
MNGKNILLNIDPNLKKNVRIIAKKMGLSVSAYIRMNLSHLVNMYIDNNPNDKDIVR